jgi:hypothetical protein
VVIVVSSEEVAAANRLVVDVDVVTREDEVAGENADVTASDDAMTAAV